MDQQLSIANKTLHLESHQLDCEFQKIIDHAVDSINLEPISDEIKVLLRFYISSRLLKNGETIGSKVYKLKLANDSYLGSTGKPGSKSLMLFNVLNIIVPYLFKKKENLQWHLQKVLGNDKASQLSSDNIIALFKAVSIVNFLVFLFQEKYLSIVERVSRIVPVISDRDYCTSMTVNRVQMDLINRELIWRELASFLTTVIPHIRTEKIYLKLGQALSHLGLGAQKCTWKLKKDDIHQVDLHRCGICKQQPFNPYTIGCRHIFCYYCMETRRLLDPESGYSCSKCNYATSNTSEARRHKVYQPIGES